MKYGLTLLCTFGLITSHQVMAGKNRANHPSRKEHRIHAATVAQAAARRAQAEERRAQAGSPASSNGRSPRQDGPTRK